MAWNKEEPALQADVKPAQHEQVEFGRFGTIFRKGWHCSL